MSNALYKILFFLFFITSLVLAFILYNKSKNSFAERVITENGIQGKVMLSDFVTLTFKQNKNEEITEAVLMNIKSDQSFTQKFDSTGVLSESYVVNLETGNDFSLVMGGKNIKLIRVVGDSKLENYIHFKDQEIREVTTYLGSREASMVTYANKGKLGGVKTFNWPTRNTMTQVNFSDDKKKPIITLVDLLGR